MNIMSELTLWHVLQFSHFFPADLRERLPDSPMPSALSSACLSPEKAGRCCQGEWHATAVWWMPTCSPCHNRSWVYLCVKGRNEQGGACEHAFLQCLMSNKTDKWEARHRGSHPLLQTGANRTSEVQSTGKDSCSFGTLLTTCQSMELLVRNGRKYQPPYCVC